MGYGGASSRCKDSVAYHTVESTNVCHAFAWRFDCLQERAKMGSMGKSDPKALGVSLHDHISRSRASITVMTSSWGDCTPGPLGMCVPSGLMPESELKKFNEAHRGVAYAIMSSGRSHFMTGSTWTEMLYQLYTPALDKQRQKYSLTNECRGRFLADAWTGFRSAQDGEAVERTAWERLNNMQMPLLD